VFLPNWDFAEVHSRYIPALRRKVFVAIRSLTAPEVLLLGPLLWLRRLPARLLGRRPPASSRADRNRPILDVVEHGGFLVLDVDEEREIVAGVVGRFWRPVANDTVRLPCASAFLAFDEPGYAKAAVNFRLEDEGEGCRVTTETRILATDAESRRSFARYWSLIRPGSGLIRRSWLRAIARRARRRA
jgi:hypothetical protein